MSNRRINEEMNTMGIATILAGNNPDSLSICHKIMADSRKVDPDAIHKDGLGNLFILDAMNVYDERIFTLYRDVCGEHFGRFIAVLRARQLSIGMCLVDSQTVNHAIDNRGEGIDVDTLVIAVQKQLPKFNVNALI